jgi:hypothetical protein
MVALCRYAFLARGNPAEAILTNAHLTDANLTN